MVDDASCCDVPAVIASCPNRFPVRLLRNDTPLGAPASRNRALREARSTWVAGLDDDDEWLPERITTLLALATTHHVALACAGDWLVDSRGHHVRRTPPPRIDQEAILRRNAVGNQALFRRQDALDIGGFDETLESAQDHDFWIRLIAHAGPAVAAAEPLQNIHLGTSGITSSPHRRSGYWHVYRKHRHAMSRTIAASHLYGLHKASGKRLGLRTARTFFVPGNRLRVLARLLSERLPFLHDSLQHLASTTRRWRA